MHRAVVDFFRSFKICTYEISGTVLGNNGKENIGRSKIKSIYNFQVSTTPPGAGGGGGDVTLIGNGQRCSSGNSNYTPRGIQCGCGSSLN